MPDTIMTRAAIKAQPDFPRLDPAKAERHRRWACKIASELPSAQADALDVLKLAERLILWSGTDKMPRPDSKSCAQ